MKNKRGIYILFCVSFIIATIVIWFVYKTDMPSTVTVQNGETEVYNGVSIGDVVMAVISIAITALLGMVTYIQTQVSIEQDIWEKTPFFAIQFDTYETLSEYCAGYDTVMKTYENYQGLVKTSPSDQELRSDFDDFKGENEQIIEEVEMLRRNMHPHLRYIKGYIAQGDLGRCNLNITNMHEGKFFSVDVFNIKWDEKKLKKEYCSDFSCYADDKRYDGEKWGVNTEEYKSGMEILDNLAKENLMPNCLLNETKIPLLFDENESKKMSGASIWNCDEKNRYIPPTVDKYVGLDIEMTNGYKYCQLFRLSLKCMDISDTYVLFAVMSYDTEIVSGVASEFEIKKAIKKLDAKQKKRKDNRKI